MPTLSKEWTGSRRLGGKILGKCHESLDGYIENITTPAVQLDANALLKCISFMLLFSLHRAFGLLVCINHSLLYKAEGLMQSVTIGQSDNYNYWLHQQAVLKSSCTQYCEERIA